MFKRLLMGVWVALCMTDPAYEPALTTLEPSDKDMLVWSDTQLVANVFGNCGRPCVVHRNGGGYVMDFAQAADAIARLNTRLVIDGDCYSACAIAADRIRSRTCITPRAAFHFHKATAPQQAKVGSTVVQTGEISYFDPNHSVQIDAWVYARGGYPKVRFLKMPFEEAKRFWRVCGQDAPLPRPDPRRR